MHPSKLADMISSRICHDLISPVGAISNGVELMGDLNGPSPELDLINQSADTAKAKLMFFRVAFGASSYDSMLGCNATINSARDMFAIGRISVDFPEPWGDRSRSLVKLLYLLLLCVESSLPRGGEIVCMPTDSGWQITVADTKIDAPTELWESLLNSAPFGDLPASQIQFQLARDAAERIDIKLTAAFSENHLTLIF
ncbi:MAG: hypothetical protein JKY31_09055 [Rhodobacteraceae bacterium]|nr:hypothetical protein [Paracoccaceae bacterium]